MIRRARDVIAAGWIRVRFPTAAGIFTHMTARERLLLTKLARVAPGETFVEVGSYLGASAAFIAEGIRRRPKGSKLHCVDTWMNDGMTEGARDTWAEFTANTSPYGDLIQAHRGDSKEVAEIFNLEVGLLFLDGDHSYQAVSTDVASWLPKVQRGGIVVCHDVGWADGVQRVVAESIEPLAASTRRLENIYWARLG